MYNYNPVRIAEFDVGIFCVNREGATSFESPETTKGTTERLVQTPQLVDETLIVPAIDQLYFGVFLRERLEHGTVKITVTHPPLGAGGATVESWESNLSMTERQLEAYYLGLSDGNPVGRWTFVGRQGIRVLFYVEFDVVPVGDRQDPCKYMPLS